MYATRTDACLQHTRIHAHRSSCDSDSVFNLLTSDVLLDTVETLSPTVYRERLYSPTTTLSIFLAQAMSADRSCQRVVNQAAIRRLGSGLSPCSTDTGAYCRARQRLPLAMVRGLAQQLGALIDESVPQGWQARRVRIVDGTTVGLPDTAANQSAFPQESNQKPGLGFPICRLVGITCLASGALLNAALGRYQGKGGDEQTLLRSIQDTFVEGDIVLGDAFFSTYFFLATMAERGVDILMGQHGARKRSTDFSRGQRLGPCDHLIVIDKPKKRPDWMSEAEYAAAPNSLTLREFQVNGKVLVTSLLDPKIASKAQLKALYQSRWQIELDLRHIKTTMGMDVLSCKSPEMAEKEIWVHLLAYNLIRFMMAQSAMLADIAPRLLSFKHCLQLWLIWVQQVDTSNDEMLPELCRLMAQQRVGNRPGRVEPRAVKRRPKPHPLLTKPRQLARQQIRTYGHPKKA